MSPLLFAWILLGLASILRTCSLRPSYGYVCAREHAKATRYLRSIPGSWCNCSPRQPTSWITAGKHPVDRANLELERLVSTLLRPVQAAEIQNIQQPPKPREQAGSGHGRSRANERLFTVLIFRDNRGAETGGYRNLTRKSHGVRWPPVIFASSVGKRPTPEFEKSPRGRYGCDKLRKAFGPGPAIIGAGITLHANAYRVDGNILQRPPDK